MTRSAGLPTFSFVHAADLHLDTPFRGLSAWSPRVATALADASLEAWDALVALCLREEAAFLLLAGDLHDADIPGVRARLQLYEGTARLAAAGCRVFIVRGNHDGGDETRLVRAWPEGVYVFGSDTVASVPVYRDGTLLATVHGLSHAGRHVAENLAERFPRPEGPGIHVALLHANLGRDTGHASYAPCSLRDLVSSGHHYWALGHVHRRRVERHGHTWVAYPGNLQGRSPQPAERGAKGALVCRVNGEVIEEPRFHALDRWRFEERELQVPDGADLPLVQALLAECAKEVVAEVGERGVLLRVVLAGADDVRSFLGPRGVLDTLRRLLDDLMPDSLILLPLRFRLRDGFTGGVAATGPRGALEAFVAEFDGPAREAWMRAQLEAAKDPGPGRIGEDPSVVWDDARQLALAALAGEEPA